ncbi:MAG: opgD [Hyphomicrobiales bacterium]|nr:opgD [Hyphomicrobiales bacterium]
MPHSKPDLTRRAFNMILASTATLSGALPALAQSPQQKPARFGFEDVLKRARDLATAPVSPAPNLPEAVQKLDFDAWKDIRFRPDRAFLNGGASFRLQAFHLGHLYRRPVTINIIREGIATPIPYAPGLFDYGRTKLDKPLPVNVGFAGFRLHYPLNDPKVFDEAIAFLGANAFRLLGRGQRYGLSAQGIVINAGTESEETPHFLEFWIESPEAGAEKIVFYALLDGESLTGAYRFELAPGVDSAMDVSLTLFPRRQIHRLGIAPLSTLFLNGENDRRYTGDFRPELHDSDGLLINSGGGEWLWRPLRNPMRQARSTFVDNNPRGFGLLQRDRNFEHYQDLDLNYELRPSYWVEPQEGWGEGRLELVENPAADDIDNNVTVAWTPNAPVEPGKPVTLSYRLTSGLDMRRLSPNGRAISTYQTQARALGSQEPIPPGSRRFIIDFAGGELRYFLTQPELVEFVPSSTVGDIKRAFVVPNAQTGGFRAAFDVQVEPGATTDLRGYLRAGQRALTETWTYPWHAE